MLTLDAHDDEVAGGDGVPAPFTQLGGDPVDNDDPLLATLFVPLYIFLENGWRVRPMEIDHDCEVTGIFSVRGGGNPFVRTLGNYQVNTKYTVPVVAQGIATGSSSGPSAFDIAKAVRAELANELALIDVATSTRPTLAQITPDIKAALEGSGGKLDRAMKAAISADDNTS